jgi:hypothetical protein
VKKQQHLTPFPRDRLRTHLSGISCRFHVNQAVVQELSNCIRVGVVIIHVPSKRAGSTPETGCDYHSGGPPRSYQHRFNATYS